MEVEYSCEGELALAMMAAGTTTTDEQEEEGWQTPTREDCRIPVVPPCPPAPSRKKAVAMPELGASSNNPRRDREPPKGGYFQPPDLESFFVLVQPRRQEASSCA